MTPDDTVSAYIDITTDPAYSGTFYTAIYNSAGGDSTWFTGDDTILFNIKATLDIYGNKVFDSFIRDAGGDGNWLTADDQIHTTYSSGSINNRFNKWQYDGLGNTSRSISVDSGPDLIPLSGDDLTWSYWQYVYSNNLETHRVNYSAVGVDSTWFTSDDVISSYYGNGYDGMNKIYELWFLGPGADNQWFTFDDLISSQRIFVYDNAGILLELLYCNDAGPDSQWLTGDEPVATRYEYSYIYDSKGLYADDEQAPLSLF